MRIGQSITVGSGRLNVSAFGTAKLTYGKIGLRVPPMNCPKCSSEKVAATNLDERQVFRCAECRHQWYSQRELTCATYVVLDDIVDDLMAKGHHETHIAFLINGVWPSDRFHECADKWTVAHGFGYEVFYRSEGNKPQDQWVRFYRLPI